MRTTTPHPVADERRRAAEEVLANLGHALGSLRCAGSQRLVRLGISMTHFHVLTLLRHHDAMPMGRLAEILDASMSSTTGIIDRMEERGLVERVRVTDDRRVVLVRPTQAGLDVVDEAELVKSELIGRALARLAPEQLDRMASAVTDLQAAVLQELRESTDPAVLAMCEHGRSHHAADAPIQRRTAHEPGAVAPLTGPAGA
jgi:DNA-binding MarR family transcriptional regulator